MHKIYLIKNLRNGKVYVGKTKWSLRRRYWEHTWSARNGLKGVLYSAIRKYGESSFIIGEICSAETNEEASRLEIEYIAWFKSTQKEFGYNITRGGEGWSGTRHTEEWKRKHSESMRGEKHPRYGKSASVETRRLISEGNKGKQAPNRRTDLEDAKVVDLYQSGLSTVEIAAQFGCHKSMVRARLIRSGIKLRASNKEISEMRRVQMRFPWGPAEAFLPFKRNVCPECGRSA